MPETQVCVLVVEDDADLREAMVDTIELSDYRCLQAANGREALQVLTRHSVDMIVSDVNMPEMDGLELLKQVRVEYPHIPMLLVTAFGCIDRSVDAMRSGAVDYIVKPFEPDVLIDLLNRHIVGRSDTDDGSPIAEDPASRRILQLAARVSKTEATVLITGESGTGKEVLARYIHAHSDRAGKDFIAINCAAIPENMLEAILFGYEKGAFTGAHQSSSGKFEQANGGTLLLDEISEMDIGLQAKLLRVLQEQEVERLGGKRPIALDVRVLATSNRNLLAAVERGEFREDLYYRLNVFPLHWQPLRERRADILPLAEHLLSVHSVKMRHRPCRLDDEAREALLAHHWPGNIRELDNVMQRALILQSGALVTAGDICITDSVQPVTAADGVAANDADLSEPAQTDSALISTAAEPRPTSSHDGLGANLKDHEFELIARCLKKNNFNRQKTAAELSVSERTLRYKLAKMRDQGWTVDRASADKLAEL